MTTIPQHKLKTVLQDWTPHTIATHAWLQQRGVSHDLAREYVNSGWLERLGPGTFKRPKDDVTWQGALFSLQTQLGLKVHVGALTALTTDGNSHYARPGGEPVFLFSKTGTTLPKWFREHAWPAPINLTQTNLLPPEMGLREIASEGFQLRASSAERAILEALHLAPNDIDLVELFQIVEGLRTLRPKLMQALLEACNSIKVKRLFLFLAQKASLPIIAHLDRKAISLGSGDRMLVPGGTYVAEFGLIVPKDLAPA
jgi:hypothetical protein